MYGMANYCYVCDKEVPETPDGVRSGYCSEDCWQQWVKENKDKGPIMYPYVPMQVTKIKLR